MKKSKTLRKIFKKREKMSLGQADVGRKYFTFCWHLMLILYLSVIHSSHVTSLHQPYLATMCRCGRTLSSSSVLDTDTDHSCVAWSVLGLLLVRLNGHQSSRSRCNGSWIRVATKILKGFEQAAHPKLISYTMLCKLVSFTLKVATKSWIQYQRPSPKIFKEFSLQLFPGSPGLHWSEGNINWLFIPANLN